MTVAPSVERQRVHGFDRLDLGLRQASDWYLWGPYLSERQWGTVREDDSPDGDVIRRRHRGYPKASEVIQRLVQGEETT
ncbi:MAG: hypothetical protein QOG79_2924 [Mycobacterium sp.]|jgi:hypothetical protein|nr:hypothetical protein [Mycobacterium sp.]MDT5299682.1 hypothetical protein [Mycobacterium sp.]